MYERSPSHCKHPTHFHFARVLALMLARLQRLQKGVRELGWSGILYRIVATACGWVGIRLVWYVLTAQPVNAARRVPTRLGRNIIIRMFEEANALLSQAPRPGEIFAARFHQGSVCLAATSDDRLLGFLWLCPRQYIEDDVRCVFVTPQSGQAWWDYDVWVRPELRNGIVFTKLWQAAHEYLASHQVEWTLSRITRNNRASIGSHRRLGALSIGNAWFVCGKQWQIMVTDRSPRFHFSHAPTDMPMLQLDIPCGSTEPPEETGHSRNVTQ